MSKDLIPSTNEMQIIESMAKYAIDSKHLEKIGGIAGATAIALYARELGIPLMAAMYGGIRPVLGKVEIAPQMMNAMIRKAGHKLHTKNHTDQVCSIYGKRKDTGEEMVSTFSIDDAKRAKIFKAGGAWETYPKNMTYARALSNLARWLFPDVIGMAYVEGELDQSSESHEEEVIEVVEEPKVEAKPVEPNMGMKEDLKLMELIGDDIEYRNRIFTGYSKILQREVKSFLDIPLKNYEQILNKIVAHNEERLQKELEVKDA